MRVCFTVSVVYKAREKHLLVGVFHKNCREQIMFKDYQGFQHSPLMFRVISGWARATVRHTDH